MVVDEFEEYIRRGYLKRNYCFSFGPLVHFGKGHTSCLLFAWTQFKFVFVIKNFIVES